MAFWTLYFPIFFRCAPNHGGRAAGLPRVVLALGHEFQTHIGILSLRSNQNKFAEGEQSVAD